MTDDSNGWASSSPPGYDPRLCPRLQAVAGDARAALRAATKSWSTDVVLARAFADLAVTGRAANAQLERMLAQNELTTDVLTAGDASLSSAASSVIGYVEAVRDYLHCGQRARLRSELVRSLGLAPGALPWLAVCAEKDPPWRPVNGYATNRRQRDETLTVRGGRITCRTAVTGSGTEAVVLLHGLGSRLEESEHLAAELGDRYTVYAIDLPSQGYSQRVDLAKLGVNVAGRRDWQRQSTFQTLALMDEVVKAYVDLVAGGKRVAILGGGSLGGSLTMMAAMRDTATRRRYVAWSPGCIWESLQKFPASKAIAYDKLWNRMIAPEKVGSPPSAPHDRANDTRHDYLRFTYDDPAPFESNASLWWRSGLAHKAELVAASREDRREIYDARFRRTCLALAIDQSFFSVVDQEAGELRKRIERAAWGLYVIAGSDDPSGAPGEEIPKCARRMGASGATSNVGWVSVLPHTGHSIHDERPKTLARLIRTFADARL